MTSLVAAVWLIAIVPGAVASIAATPMQPSWFVALRLFYAAWVVGVALVAPRVRAPHLLDALALSVAVVGCGATFALQGRGAADDYSYLAVDFLPVVGLWAVMPNRFAFQASGALLLTARTWAILALFRAPVPSKIWHAAAIATVVANVVGAVASWTLHRTRRLQFLAVREENAARRALEVALSQVRTMRGLVPMCSCCKSIRTPDGAWVRLEEVLAKHTEAELTHGFCDACLQRLYPDSDEREESR